MIAKKFKLTRIHVNELKSSHKKHQSKFFSCNYSVVDQSYNQFSVVVSKKVHKSAVARNKIKRLVYRFLSDHLKKNNQSIQAMLYCRKNTLQATSEDMEKDIQDLCGAIC